MCAALTHRSSPTFSPSSSLNNFNRSVLSHASKKISSGSLVKSSETSAIDISSLEDNIDRRDSSFETIPPSSSSILHDEFLQYVQESGIEGIATEAGIVQNGEIPVLREYTGLADTSSLESNASIESQQASSSSPSWLGNRGFRKRKSDDHFSGLVPANIQTNGLSTISTSGVFSMRHPNSSRSLLLNTGSDMIENFSFETTGSVGLIASDSSAGKRRKRVGQRGSISSAEEKFSKGLRHFSLKVCEKVEKKKNTTYNEVADELVQEMESGTNIGDKQSPTMDQKNIRRRVYDALNVLMATNIITKEKKEIKWVGLPANARQELHSLEAERIARIDCVNRKRMDYNELLAQYTAYRNLLERNTHRFIGSESKIFLPFIIVNTKSQTIIECEVADNRSAYFFNFSMPFEIHDDAEILKRMGMMQTTLSNPSEENNVVEFSEGSEMICTSDRETARFEEENHIQNS